MRRLSGWRRIALRLTIAFVAGMLAFCLHVALRIRSANSMQTIVNLPAANYLANAKRILVVSPHPDDETLGCGGLISEAKHNGSSVRVVFVTNGDGFRVAAERELKRLKVSSSGFVQFGDDRQKEALRADAKLGLTPSDIIFLGFPDRGTVPLWTRYWSKPFRSYYTKLNHCGYPDAYKPDLPYTGQALLGALTDIILKYRPTEILVTHPQDDHPDHYGAFAFTTAALEEIREKDPGYAAHVHLDTFIIHRGEWPLPRTLATRDDLAPPAGLTVTGTSWKILRLGRRDVKAKDSALEQYRSQTAIMGSFLRSFIRSNELFGTLAPESVETVPDGAIKLDGLGNDWATLRPQIEDPAGDTLGRALREGADLRRVWLAKDAKYLYVRVDTVKPMPRSTRLYVYLRSIDGKESKLTTLFYDTPGKMSPRTVDFVRRGNIFEARVPLARLGPTGKLWVGASTFYLGFNIDKTGWRPIVINDYKEPAATASLPKKLPAGLGDTSKVQPDNPHNQKKRA